MNIKDIKRDILAGLISRDNAINGYDEKLGIRSRLDSVWDANLNTLNSFREKVKLADKLIEKYKLEGNDLDNETTFNKLSTDVNLIFKPKGFFSFFK